MSFSSRPTLESWFDIIKRVIRVKGKRGPLTTDHKGKHPASSSDDQATEDANGFTVFLYDEED